MRPKSARYGMRNASHPDIRGAWQARTGSHRINKNKSILHLTSSMANECLFEESTTQFGNRIAMSLPCDILYLGDCHGGEQVIYATEICDDVSDQSSDESVSSEDTHWVNEPIFRNEDCDDFIMLKNDEPPHAQLNEISEKFKKINDTIDKSVKRQLIVKGLSYKLLRDFKLFSQMQNATVTYDPICLIASYQFIDRRQRAFSTSLVGHLETLFNKHCLRSTTRIFGNNDFVASERDSILKTPTAAFAPKASKVPTFIIESGCSPIESNPLIDVQWWFANTTNAQLCIKIDMITQRGKIAFVLSTYRRNTLDVDDQSLGLDEQLHDPFTNYQFVEGVCISERGSVQTGINGCQRLNWRPKMTIPHNLVCKSSHCSADSFVLEQDAFDEIWFNYKHNTN